MQGKRVCLNRWERIILLHSLKMGFLGLNNLRQGDRFLWARKRLRLLSQLMNLIEHFKIFFSFFFKQIRWDFYFCLCLQFFFLLSFFTNWVFFWPIYFAKDSLVFYLILIILWHVINIDNLWRVFFLSSSIGFAISKFKSSSTLFGISCPYCKMMKNNGCGYCNIKWSRFWCILRDIYERIAYFYLLLI